jgi:hypothetical protein
VEPIKPIQGTTLDTNASVGCFKTESEIILKIIASLQHRFTKLELLVHKLEQQN